MNDTEITADDCACDNHCDCTDCDCHTCDCSQCDCPSCDH